MIGSKLIIRLSILTMGHKFSISNFIRDARATILNMACSMGYKPCIANATAIFNKFMQDPVANK